ncbi:MAG TPA: PAS domain-containing protein, partial [Gemmatimonadales bacterium]|nr:PAS domain-containing protein [Gemmatimonadales bacterium]
MDQHLLLLVPDAPSHHRHVTALREAGFRVAAVPSRAEALRAAALSGGLLVAESSLLDGSPDVPPGLLIIHQLPLLDEPCLESAEACVPLATTPSRLVGVVRRQLRRRAREERLRGAARTLGLGVFEFDFATQRGEYSPEVKAMLGVPEGDAIPLDADFVPLAVHPEDRDTLLAAVARAAEPEAGGEFSCDYRVRHPDGTVRWV